MSKGMIIEIKNDIQLGEQVPEKGDRLMAEIHLLRPDLKDYALTGDDCFLVEEKPSEETNSIEGNSNMLSLPTKKSIEAVVESRYKEMYGTNYDYQSLDSAKQGAVIAIRWIMENN